MCFGGCGFAVATAQKMAESAVISIFISFLLFAYHYITYVVVKSIVEKFSVGGTGPFGRAQLGHIWYNFAHD